MTLDELYKAWITYQKKIIKGSAIVIYARNYDNYIRNIFGLYRISSIKRMDIENFLFNMRENYSYNTIASVKSTLSNMLRYAVKNNYIAYNVCKDVEFVKNKTDKTKKIMKDETKYLTDKQIKVFFDYCDENDFKVRHITKLMLYTGLRGGEV